ncbi:MAG TPA: hypothetical protein VLH84_02690 [Patescibacteria group bacterium]|nr:hypothetical protein [Patescibacteria group bacterium]
MRILSKLSIMTVGFLVSSFTSVAVVAAESNSHAHAEDTTTTTTQTTETEDTTEGSNTTESHTGKTEGTDGSTSHIGTKLAEAKLKVCQKRETTVNNIMARIADRGQKQLDLFTSIATRVETFYANKGKTLSNYDALVADVNAKKDAAQTEVDSVKATSVTFKCDGTDPKGTAQSFKGDLKAEIDALKAYKTAVKNLIVGVKSVQGSTTSADNSQGGDQ